MESKSMPWFLRVNKLLNQKRLSYAWITGGILWISWLVSIMLGNGNLDLAGHVIGTDYIQFFAAGTTLKIGESERLYDLLYQSQLQKEIAGPSFEDYHAFITPPFLVYLYLPLSHFPYNWSFGLWSLLGFSALWISLKLTKGQSITKAFLYSLTWFPIFASISFGQNSLLSLLLIALTYYLWRKEHFFGAGLVSSLLLYKPYLLAGVILLWLFRYKTDYRSLLGLLLGSFSIAGLSLLTLPEASRDYFFIARDFIAQMNTWEGFPHWHSNTLRTFWMLLFPNNSMISEALYIGMALICIFFFLKYFKIYNTNQNLVFGTAVCLTVVISPHTMVYDWAILLIPAVLFWNIFIDKRELILPIYATMWAVALVSGGLTLIQMNIFPFAVQISVPILLLGLYFLNKELSLESKEGREIKEIPGTI
jgi:alpha-1,2-mannosyltransferase